MVTESNNPYQAPGASIEAASVASLVLAGRFRRLVAVFVDGLLGVLVGFVLGLIAWRFMAATQGFFDAFLVFGSWTATHRLLYGAFGLPIGLLIFLAIHGRLLASHGQTVGKHLLGIRIARPDGSKPDFWRIVGLRYLVIWVLSLIAVIGPIFGLVDALLIFRSSRRCLHDNIADTIVVEV